MATDPNDTAHYPDKVQVVSGPNHSHLEGDLKHEHEVVLKSSFDDLGLIATAKKFKKVRRYDTLVVSCNADIVHSRL